MARRTYTPADIEWWQARAEHLEERLAEADAELARLRHNAQVDSGVTNGFKAAAEGLERRLAEVEAELRDCKAQGVLEGNLDHVKWKSERKRAEAAEARLALETENAIKAGALYLQSIDTYSRLSRSLEARLAKVTDRLEMFKRAGSMDSATVDGLIAILRGEDDHG